MWACLEKVKDALHLLRHYIEGLDKQDQLLVLQTENCGDGALQIKALQEHFRSKNNKAQYEYNTIIVSLYGYLEKFIEDLIGEYLSQLTVFVPHFPDLPSAIQEKHLMLSLDLSRKTEFQ